MSYFPGNDALDAAIDRATSSYGTAGAVYGEALKAGMGLAGGAITASAAPAIAAVVAGTVTEIGASIGGAAATTAAGVLASSATAAGSSLVAGAGVASAVAPYAIPVIVVVAAAAGIALGFEQAAANVDAAYQRAFSTCLRAPPYGTRIAPVGTGPKGSIRPVDLLLRQDGGGPYGNDPSPTSLGEALRAIEVARLSKWVDDPDDRSFTPKGRLAPADVLTNDDRATLKAFREAIERDARGQNTARSLVLPLYLSTLVELQRRGLTASAWTQAWLLSRGMSANLAAILAPPDAATPNVEAWQNVANPYRFEHGSGWSASAVRLDWPPGLGARETAADATPPPAWCWFADLLVPPIRPSVAGLPFGVQAAKLLVDDWSARTSAIDAVPRSKIRVRVRVNRSSSKLRAAQRRRVVFASSALLLTGAAVMLRSAAWRSILSQATRT